MCYYMAPSIDNSTNYYKAILAAKVKNAATELTSTFYSAPLESTPFQSSVYRFLYLPTSYL